MKVFIQTVEGETHTLNVKPSTTIRSMKSKIYKNSGIPMVQRQLTFKGEELKDEKTIKEYQIMSGTFLYALTLFPVIVQISDLNNSEAIKIYTYYNKTIKDLKEKVSRIAGLFPSDFGLLFAGKVLEDKSTILESKIKIDSEIVMLKKPTHEIIVKTTCGKYTTSMHLSAATKIKQIKECISGEKSIPISQQHLYYDYRKLGDESMLSEIGIHFAATLTLTTFVDIKIALNRFTEFTVNMPRESRINDIKNYLQEKHSIPANNQILIFNKARMDNSTLISDIHNDISQLTIDLKLAVKITIQAPNHSLILSVIASNLRKLKHEISSMLKLEESEIQLFCKGIELIVLDKSTTIPPFVFQECLIKVKKKEIISIKTFKGEISTFIMPGDITIRQIKEEICKRTKGKPSMIRLISQGIEFSDSSKFNELGVSNNSLLLYNRIQPIIHILIKQSANRIFSLDVEENYTVGFVKGMIEKVTGIPKNKQGLVLKAKELKDDDKLSKIGVKEDSMLRLETLIEVNVKCITGRKITLYLSLMDTINQLKTLIEKKESIPQHLQRFCFNGKELDDCSTLRGNGVEDGSCIYLVNRMKPAMSIIAKGDYESIFHIEVEPNETIKSVKKKLRKLMKAITEMELHYKGIILDDKHSLEHYKIGEKAILNIRKHDAIFCS